MNKILETLEAEREELADWRHDFHMHPELGLEETRTAGIVAQKLRSWGIEVTEHVGVTGVVGVINGDLGPGRSIGLRCDMDALPITECSSQSWKSTVKGKMHACGHDGHTTMLLAAARYLSQHRNFRGRVVLVFQPAEEGTGGALAMIKDGLFERFPISDTSVLSAASSGCPVMEHAATQLPYALLTAFAAGAGYLVSGFTNGNLWLSWGTAVAVLGGGLWWFLSRQTDSVSSAVTVAKS